MGPNKNVYLPDAMWQYMQKAWLREPELLRELREETERLPSNGLQISPDQGQLMGLIARIAGAKKALEVGVYTGYSSLSVMLQMPADARLTACDISEEFTSVARRYWQKAGISDRVTLLLGPAVDSLKSLLEAGEAGTYDLAFVDADKPNYPNYINCAIELLRPGGVLMIDNVFWSGAVADPDNTDEGTELMRRINAQVFEDARLDVAVIPIGDGVTLAIKK